MNLEKLQLEKIKIPKNIKSKMQDGVWECYDYDPFVINISEIAEGEKEGLSYSLEFLPTAEIFESTNRNLERQKYIADGYGWADYILHQLKKNKVEFSDEVGSDSESGTCVLYANNEKDFKVLLQNFSLYIRTLSKTKIDTTEGMERKVSIKVSWSHTDEHDGIDKAEKMFSRPRIDYRVSEYVWNFINENLLAPKKILSKYDLTITLHLGKTSKKAKFHYNSEYNTDDKKFRPASQGSKAKWISIFCNYDGFSETMSPTEFAGIIYDMFCSFVIDNFKKITKKECDELKTGMDIDFINSYDFPASFDNQKYSGDEGGYGGRMINFVPDEQAIPYNYRETYLKHYGK